MDTSEPVVLDERPLDRAGLVDRLLLVDQGNGKPGELAEGHEKLMAVLTSEQKEQLKQQCEKHKDCK
jgi:hypothetical protein